MHLNVSPVNGFAAWWDAHSEGNGKAKHGTEQVCWQCVFSTCQPYKLGHRQLQVPQPAQITVGQRQKRILWHLGAKLYRLILKPLSFPKGKEKYRLCCTRCLLCTCIIKPVEQFSSGDWVYLSIHIYIHSLYTHTYIYVCTHIHICIYINICISQSCLQLQWQLGIQK